VTALFFLFPVAILCIFCSYISSYPCNQYTYQLRFLCIISFSSIFPVLLQQLRLIKRNVNKNLAFLPMILQSFPFYAMVSLMISVLRVIYIVIVSRCAEILCLQFFIRLLIVSITFLGNDCDICEISSFCFSKNIFV
jgi:hypothetical protein